MKIKILTFKEFQGNKCRVQNYVLRKGKWEKNPKYDFHKRMIEINPVRFLWFEETEREVKE